MEELVVNIVALQGSSFELGLVQSEEVQTTQLRQQLQFLENLTANSNSEKAKEILQAISPNLLEELRGLAKGLNIKLDTIIKLYSGYDVTFPSMGCTAFINDDYYVRNYDFSPQLYDGRLVFSNPVEGYAGIGFS